MALEAPPVGVRDGDGAAHRAMSTAASSKRASWPTNSPG